MTSVQIKEEIQEALNHVPETALADVLNFVKGIQTSSEQTKLEDNLDKIMKEDKSSLERLAK